MPTLGAVRQFTFPAWIDRRYALLAAVLAVPSVALGILASIYDTFPLDTAAMHRAQAIGSVYEPVAEVFNEYNWLIAIAVFTVGTAALLIRRRPDAALIFLAAAGARPYLSELKEFVDRPRPSGDFPILDVVGNSSFPSGHVMTAVTYLGLLFVLAPEILPRSFVLPARVGAAAIIVLYALSRMWAGVHWLSDTYGAVLWASTLLAILMALRPGFAEVCDRAADAWRAHRSL